MLRLGATSLSRGRWPKLSGSGPTRGLTSENWLFALHWEAGTDDSGPPIKTLPWWNARCPDSVYHCRRGRSGSLYWSLPVDCVWTPKPASVFEHRACRVCGVSLPAKA